MTEKITSRTNALIRQATKSDLPELERIAAGTGMFVGDELAAFVHVMSDQLDTRAKSDAAEATLIVASNGEATALLGAAYFTPEVMAQGVANLLFIGVDPEAQRTGVGTQLLAEFERTSKATAARLAIIETASAPMFEPAWGLYLRHGYQQVARVPDFYDDGLDKLIFRKRLTLS